MSVDPEWDVRQPGSSRVHRQATLAELMRATAGLTETMSTTAGDLDANKTTYASTEDANQGMFGQIKPR